MPHPIISHQAPTLFIKIKYPKRIDGTAICIGSLVPDLCEIFPLGIRPLTHSLLGLFIWTAPLTILLTMLFCRHIGPIISKFAKKDGLISKPLKYHLLFDLPAHGGITLFYPWTFPVPHFLQTLVIDLGTITIGIWQYDVSYRIYNVIWHIENAILFFISLYLLRNIKKHNLISKWDKNLKK